MKLTLIAFAVVVAAGVALAMPAVEDDGSKTVAELWAQWKADNKKAYETMEEETRRLGIFTENKKRIDEHNEKYKKGEVTWKQGLTNFADLTTEEFQRTHLGGLRPLPAKE